MFFLFIFSLVFLSDPLPTPATLSVNIDNGKSHVSPFPTKTINSTPILSQGNGNDTSDIFFQTTVLNEHLSETDRKSLSALSTPISIPSPSVFKQNDVPKFIGETEGKSEKVNSYIEDNRQIKYSSVVLPTTSMYQRTSTQIEQVPLLLKLDRNYTPRQIAEYIFSTGDEKGFAQGVGEMVEDGELMVSRDDVIAFLEAVQKELAKLREDRGKESRKVGESGKGNV